MLRFRRLDMHSKRSQSHRDEATSSTLLFNHLKKGDVSPLLFGGSQQQGRIHQQPQPAFPIDSCVRAPACLDVTDGHPHGIFSSGRRILLFVCFFNYKFLTSNRTIIIHGNYIQFYI